MGEQKNHFTEQNMKLQFIFLASSMAVIFSKNLPVPGLNKNTQHGVNKLKNNAAKKAEALLAAQGVKVDVDGRLKKLEDSVKPQLNQIKNKANQQYNQFSNTYGKWDLGQIIDTVNNQVNSRINKAEAGAPDGAKTFIDIGQDVLSALANAGKDALGNRENLTVDKIVSSAKNAAQQNINSQQVNQA